MSSSKCRRQSNLAALSSTSVDHDLGPDGPIAAEHARYEDRPSQRAMAMAIAKLYNDGGVGLLEAGTGVGKSLGYLVPALRWAAANNERTVVSTNTINLQEQLVGKDLPFLARALSDQKVRFALLKGWRNYLCLARLEQARASGNALFDDSLNEELSALKAWAERTSDGSLSDLTTPPRPEVWDEVAAEPDLCQRTQCQKFNDCFLFKARRAAAAGRRHRRQSPPVAVGSRGAPRDEQLGRGRGASRVHPLGRRRGTPSRGRGGVALGRDGIATLAATIVQPARPSRQGIAAGADRAAFRGQRLAEHRESRSRALPADVPPSTPRAARAACCSTCSTSFFRKVVSRSCASPTEFADHPIWNAGLRVALTDTVQTIEMIADGLQLVYERFEGSGKKLDDAIMPLMNEMRAVTRRMQNAADGLRQALDPERTDKTIRWIEAKGREKQVSVSTVPLDLAPILREDLFKRAATTIVTSATLATDGRFDFLTSRLGLDDPELEPRTGIYPSPFKYREQAMLAVPTDIPAPNVDAAKHFDAFARVVVDVADAADGGMFVLFTSHRDVRAMAAELRGRGRSVPWPLLVHGDESRDTLLDRFRNAGKAILLGTASFWEGVDVPGDALRALLIAKLPFRVPTEPITAAHCEAIQSAGGDPFRDYMLPHASLRLKQGFGRLIRTSADRGVVVIADPRVVTKNYGRGMIDGLPPARRIVGRWEQLLGEIQKFYTSTTTHER